MVEGLFNLALNRGVMSSRTGQLAKKRLNWVIESQNHQNPGVCKQCSSFAAMAKGTALTSDMLSY